MRAIGASSAGVITLAIGPFISCARLNTARRPRPRRRASAVDRTGTMIAAMVAVPITIVAPDPTMAPAAGMDMATTAERG